MTKSPLAVAQEALFVTIVREWAELQEALGLAKVPDHSTLWHVERKLLEKGGLHSCWRLAATADAQAV